MSSAAASKTRQQKQRTEEEESHNNNQREIYSFAAAGWLQIYHFGVGKALHDAGITNNKTIRYAGSSAGSLAAAGIVCATNMDEMRDYSIECCVDCHSKVQNAFKIREYVRVGVQHFAVNKFKQQKSGELTKRLEDQLEVYVTVLPQVRKKVLTEFLTVDDLEEALLASCCITPLAGWPFPLRKTGELVCDGGLAAFQPRQGEPNVVTVSPFYFTTADIKPDVFIPAWWGLYPPSADKYHNIFNIGYNDAIHFLVRTNRVSKRMLRRLKPTIGHKDFAPPMVQPSPLPTESSQMRADEQQETGFVSRVVFATTGVTSVPTPRQFSKSSPWKAISSLPGKAIYTLFQASYFTVDLMAAVFFLCMMRPIALFVIYGELFWVSIIYFWAALLQHLPFIGRKLRHTRRVEQHNKKRKQQKMAAAKKEKQLAAAAATTASNNVSDDGEEGEESPLGMTAAELMNTTVVYTYRGAWKELYMVWRNIVSIRVLMHVILGTHVEINAKRLEKHSRLYRVLRPFL